MKSQNSDDEFITPAVHRRIIIEVILNKGNNTSFHTVGPVQPAWEMILTSHT